MADIVNLRRARKDKKRREKGAAAAVNRAKHGEAKHTRKKRGAQTALERRRIDSHRLDGDRESDKDGEA